ncbi:MAG: hypothetical protein LUE12_05345 [Ruminococcus sp.]|nr:hypothetical protein [Ruminococcus sp.]
MKKSFLLAASLLLLTSCAKSDGASSNESEEEALNVELISVDELADDVEAALKKTPSNFVLSNYINVELPDEYYECDFQQISGFDENYESIYSSFFDEDIFKDAEITHNTTSDGMTCYSFYNNGNHCAVGDNGFITFYNSIAGDDNAYQTGDRVEVCHIDRSDTNLEKIYNDENYRITLGKIVENAQTWIDENYAPYEPDYEISVKTMIERAWKADIVFKFMPKKSTRVLRLTTLFLCTIMIRQCLNIPLRTSAFGCIRTAK